MKTITTIQALKKALQTFRQKGKRIGFVPTMGYFHRGHLSLMHRAKKENGICVVSIFVNPTQFGPDEDFERYPRDKKRDEFFAKEQNVDIMFYPSVKTLYPNRYLTYIDVGETGAVLCGAHRPGHFRGVATIVAKLLNIVEPDTVYLGQKDAQQAVVLARMIADLNFPVRIRVLPTVRERDGLALSSRNAYLTPQERRDAPAIYQSLRHARALIQRGEKNAAVIARAIRSRIAKKKTIRAIEYIACVNPKTLQPVSRIARNETILIATAVKVGAARLIDNLTVRAP